MLRSNSFRKMVEVHRHSKLGEEIIESNSDVEEDNICATHDNDKDNDDTGSDTSETGSSIFKICREWFLADDNDGPQLVVKVHGQPLILTPDLCVRICLISFVVSVAVLLVVIVASAPRDGGRDAKIMKDAKPETTFWVASEKGSRLAFVHQFLLRDSANHIAQIMGVDETKRKYVIELLKQSSKHHSFYIVVDFLEKTETYLVVSKSLDSIGRHLEERKILLCFKQSLDPTIHGDFAPASSIKESFGIEGIFNSTNIYLHNTYVVAPMVLGPLVSTAISTDCKATRPVRALTFAWETVDESLACGKISRETKNFHCSNNQPCQPYPGVPLSTASVCRNFQKCNFVKTHCDPFYLAHPALIKFRPYCACRKSAMEDGQKSVCPHVVYDGGECELPRRKLVESMSSLPCLCPYRFVTIYPYLHSKHVIKDKNDVTSGAESGLSKEDGIKLRWRLKVETIDGPALKFQDCPCVNNDI